MGPEHFAPTELDTIFCGGNYKHSAPTELPLGVHLQGSAQGWLRERAALSLRSEWALTNSSRGTQRLCRENTLRHLTLF